MMPLFWYTPLEIYALFLSIEVPDRRFLKSRPHLSVRADKTEQPFQADYEWTECGGEWGACIGLVGK